MKRKIYLSMVLSAITAMLVIAAASLSISYGFFEKQVKSDIQVQANLVKQGYDTASDKIAFLRGVQSNTKSIRVSIIEPDGNVSFDTHADANNLKDHLDRPEIMEANRDGFGEEVRRSKTLDQNTYYYALKLNDGNIIRLASSTGNLLSVYRSMLPFMALLAVVILLVCMAVAKMLTNKIVRPLEELSDHLDDLSDDANYDELNPFVEKIAKQNTTITRQLEKLKEERDTVTLITDNMKEGLILLGNNRYILSVNKSAISFLNSHQMDFVGQNLIVLTRETALLQGAELALNGTANDGIVTMQRKSFQFFANPVYENDTISGAILLLLDVTERQKVEKIRQDFSANVSHELKTPLTTISGFAEMIQNDMVQNKADLLKFSGLIYQEASRLLSLIDDIMRLSQIEEHMETKIEQVELGHIAQTVCDRLRSKAEERGVTLTLNAETTNIIGNESMLEELLNNLTENAIKYNKPQGTVHVSIKSEDSKGVIVVADTGIGIPQKHHERIFERFYRVDKSRSKQTGGTGLGLSIVKHIVEFHNGKLAFESEEGKGTTITIKL